MGYDAKCEGTYCLHLQDRSVWFDELLHMYYSVLKKAG
jgi:hypothetical protein